MRQKNHRSRNCAKNRATTNSKPATPLCLEKRCFDRNGGLASLMPACLCVAVVREVTAATKSQSRFKCKT